MNPPRLAGRCFRFAALRDAGLSGVFFRADMYHRPSVPAECVRRGARIADGVSGAEHVPVARGFPALDNVPTVAENMSVIREHPPVMVGRAARELAEPLDTVP